MLILSSRLTDRRLVLKLPRKAPDGGLVITVRDRKTMHYLGPTGWGRSQAQLPGELVKDGEEFLVTAEATEALNTTRHLQFEIPALVLTQATNWPLPAPPAPPPSPPPRLRPVDAGTPMLDAPREAPGALRSVGRRSPVMLGLVALVIAILPATGVAIMALRHTRALQDELDRAQVTITDIQAASSKGDMEFRKQLADKDARLTQANRTASEATTHAQDLSKWTADLAAAARDIESQRQKLDQRSTELDAREKSIREREAALTRRDAELAQRVPQPPAPVAAATLPASPAALPTPVTPPVATTAAAAPRFASVFMNRTGRYYTGRGDTKVQADNQALDSCFAAFGGICTETASLGGAGPKCFAVAVGPGGRRFDSVGVDALDANRRAIAACQSVTRQSCLADRDLALCAP